MIYILYFCICIAATTLGAISGIGGGVIIKPVMDALSGMGAAAISFLSGCTVLSMSAVSLLRSRGGDAKVEPRRGTMLALGAAFGGIFGKMLFDMIKEGFGNDRVITGVQSAVMVLLTAGVLIYMLKKDNIRTLQVKNALLELAIGLMLGLFSSFLGIGGGPINLVVLYFFFSMDTKTAALNSIYIILFSQSFSFLSVVLSGKIPEFQWPALVCMVLGGVLGGFVGRSLSRKMSGRQVELLFRGMLVLIIGISVYNLLKAILL